MPRSRPEVRVMTRFPRTCEASTSTSPGAGDEGRDWRRATNAALPPPPANGACCAADGGAAAPTRCARCCCCCCGCCGCGCCCAKDGSPRPPGLPPKGGCERPARACATAPPPRAAALPATSRANIAAHGAPRRSRDAD
eukprot:173461-Chlamydomonas_euryale.AAC.1